MGAPYENIGQYAELAKISDEAEVLKFLKNNEMKTLCSNSANMRWMDALPTATLGCELGTATRGGKNIVLRCILSCRPGKEVDECRGDSGVGHVGQLSTAR